MKGAKAGTRIKINDSTPFIEFYIAKALSDAGIKYKSEWGTNIPPEIEDRARAVLLEAKKSSKHPELSRLPIFENKTMAEDASSPDQTFLQKYLEDHALSECGKAFDE